MMEKNLTLLVLAAGMGSRFGGLKQIEPVGPNNEFIIDYSVKDAIKAGFNKVVFIIKEENYEIFRNTIGKRIEDKIEVKYVFQKMTDLPKEIVIPEERIKPLGTAHAIYCARDVVKENFAVINADDFYGEDAYIKAANFLSNCKSNEYANISYEIGKTITKNGAVKRGIIFSENGFITDLIESSVEEVNKEIIASPLDGRDAFKIPFTQDVSMNLFCLTPTIFTYLENNITAFFQNNADLLKCEWLLPDVVFASAKENNVKVKVIKTNSKHYGMTYKEDLEDLKKGILHEIENGVYKRNLWG